MLKVFQPHTQSSIGTHGRLSRYVSDLYDEMMLVQQKLINTQSLAQATRKISRFLQIYQRLIALMHEGTEEYPNVATHLAELDVIKHEIPISDITWLKDECLIISEYRKLVLEHGDELIMTGIRDKNQHLILNGLLIVLPLIL